jgi:signal transduction histidine kinase
MPSATARETQPGRDPLQPALLRLANRFQGLASLQQAAIHDFRGSLNALGLSVRLLEQTLASQAPGGDLDIQQRCVQSLRNELIRLERTTGTVLDAVRADEQAPSRQRLAPVIEQVRVLVEPTAERCRVSFVISQPARDLEFVGRAAWIRQAVLNLAANALEAMPAGGDLRMAVTDEGTHAAVAVSDTGPGIASGIQPRIWDVHFSTKRGLGIGLPVAAELVQAHGGTVAQAPTPSGACFVVRLPLAS